MFRSQVDALAVRQELRIVLVNAEQYDPGFPPEPYSDFLEWLDDLVKAVPAEDRNRVTIEFDSTPSYYDSHYACVEVTYRRPETDDEWEARKMRVTAEWAAHEEAQKQKELAALAALKAKYE